MSWLKRLFTRHTPPTPSQAPLPADTFTIRLDDQSYIANQDIVDGLKFSATLNINTPLSVLRHHGDFFRGPFSEAPIYGTQADGVWLFKMKTFRDLGIDVDELPDSSRASDIGSVTTSDYLPFLVQFRSVVESNDTPDQKLRNLLELPKQSAHFNDIWQKLCASYADFPASFFYFPFISLPGVGRQLAKRLYDAGFRTTDEIVTSSLDRLTAIHGLGIATATKITSLALPARKSSDA